MNQKKKYIWDKKRNIVILLKIFFGICIVLFGVDFVVHKHAHLPWEKWPGFYAIYGFVACVILVLIAKYVLRPLVKREENYYD
ncbi:MAG: hypothetical protein GY857_09955 [Desulfobacula sp.]|nr:hypothetical protein [Desulfobacula sp.]